MQKKTKFAVLTALTVCAVGLCRFGGIQQLMAQLSLYEETLCQSAFDIILPASADVRTNIRSWLAGLTDTIASLAKRTLLPAGSDAIDVENEALADFNEYEPSQSELDAFAMENARAARSGTESDSEGDVSSNGESEEAVADANKNDMAAQGSDNDVIPAVATPANGIIYSQQSLYDYTFLINNFYIVDSSTASDASLVDGETLLNRDLTIDLSGSDPKILIYHTHSQEAFADSRPGETADTVVGLGSTLADILQQKYHIQVYHDTGVYDMIDGVPDRNEAYSLAQTAVSKILEDNPSIKVVIDLHRDGVAEGTHLVTQINGKPTAKIMFFNGLCRSADNSTSGYLQNPYLTDNLAFSLQMQIKAAEKYPDFTRRIYLRDYRYNLHMCPRSLLVECGAQTNTVEEVQNAMEPLADLLYCILSGQ